MRKLLSLALALILCIGLCACDGSEAVWTEIDSEFVYEQAKSLNIRLESVTKYRYQLDQGCREELNLLFFCAESGSYNEDMVPITVLYMLDTDTGIWYDSSFLNWDIMIKGNGWNFDTKETALMCFFTFFEQNGDQPIIWSQTEYCIRMDTATLEQINQRLPEVAVSQSDPTTDENDPQLSGNPAATLTIDPQLLYEQAKLLNIRLNAAAVYQGKTPGNEPETVNLLFFQSTEYLDISQEHWSFSAPGFYMLDMDTGIWYDGSFLNWDIMTKGDEQNFDTRGTALMWYFTYYEQALSQNEDLHFPGSGQYGMPDAEELERINQKLLIDDLTHQTAAYPYASIDEEPRQLTDGEIAALLNYPAGYVKTMISTVSDAIAYLDLRFPELWMGMVYHNGVDVDNRWIRSAGEVLSNHQGEASRTCIVNCVAYLLDDDYMIESLLAFWPDPDVVNEDCPQKVINFIKTNDGYLFFDPVLRMQGDGMSRRNDLLPEMKCSSVAEYVEHIRQDPNLSTIIKYIFRNTGGVRMDFTRSFTDGYTITTDSPGIEMIYYSMEPQEPGQHIAPENIGKYRLSTMLGGVTLSVDAVKALVGQKPEVIREEIKTAGDLLMFMLAARITEGDGCYCTDVDGHTWHWNMDVQTFLRKGRGGCGDCANLANYMLDGDYEEVGFIDHTYYPGYGGSHVYNYFLHEGKYYIVDFSWFIFGNYQITQDYPVTVLDTLDQWTGQVYQNVCLVMTYDTTGMQYPVIFGEAYEQEFGGVYYILPEGVEYTVLYEAPDGYQYYHIPFDTSVYDWTAFGTD